MVSSADCDVDFESVKKVKKIQQQKVINKNMM
jgi:hypothetical protein